MLLADDTHEARNGIGRAGRVGVPHDGMNDGRINSTGESDS